MGQCWSELCSSTEAELVEVQTSKNLRRGQSTTSPTKRKETGNEKQTSVSSKPKSNDKVGSNEQKEPVTHDDAASNVSAQERERERLNSLEIQQSMRELLAQSVDKNNKTQLDEYKALLSPVKMAHQNSTPGTPPFDQADPESFGDSIGGRAHQLLPPGLLSRRQPKTRRAVKKKMGASSSMAASRSEESQTPPLSHGLESGGEHDEKHDGSSGRLEAERKTPNSTGDNEKLGRKRSNRKVTVSIKELSDDGQRQQQGGKAKRPRRKKSLSSSSSSSASSSTSSRSSGDDDDDDDGEILPVADDKALIEVVMKARRTTKHQHRTAVAHVDPSTADSTSTPTPTSSSKRRSPEPLHHTSPSSKHHHHHRSSPNQQVLQPSSPAQKLQADLLKQAREVVIETKTQGRSAKPLRFTGSSPDNFNNGDGRRRVVNDDFDDQFADDEEDQVKKIFQIPGEDEENKGKTVEEILREKRNQQRRPSAVAAVNDEDGQGNDESDDDHDKNNQVFVVRNGKICDNPSASGPSTPLRRQVTASHLPSLRQQHQQQQPRQRQFDDPVDENDDDDDEKARLPHLAADRDEVNEQHALGGFGAERDLSPERRRDRLFTSIAGSSTGRVVGGGSSWVDAEEHDPSSARSSVLGRNNSVDRPDQNENTQVGMGRSGYHDDDEQEEAEEERTMFRAAFTPASRDAGEHDRIFPVSAAHKREQALKKSALDEQEVVFYGARHNAKRSKVPFLTQPLVAAVAPKHFSPTTLLRQPPHRTAESSPPPLHSHPEQNDTTLRGMIYNNNNNNNNNNDKHDLVGSPGNRTWFSPSVSSSRLNKVDRENYDSNHNVNNEYVPEEITLQLQALREYTIIRSEEAHERRWLCGEFLVDRYEDTWNQTYAADLAPVSTLMHELRRTRFQVLSDWHRVVKQGILESQRREYRALDIILSRKVAAEAAAASKARKDRDEQKYAAPRVFRPQMMLLGNAGVAFNANKGLLASNGSLTTVGVTATSPPPHQNFTAFSEPTATKHRQSDLLHSSPSGYSSSPFGNSNNQHHNNHNNNNNDDNTNRNSDSYISHSPSPSQQQRERSSSKNYIVEAASRECKVEKSLRDTESIIAQLHDDEADWRFHLMNDARNAAIAVVELFVTLGCFPLLGALSPADRLPIVSRHAAREVTEKRRVHQSTSKLEEIASAYHFYNKDDALFDDSSHHPMYSKDRRNLTNSIFTSHAKTATLLRLCEIQQQEERLSIMASQTRYFGSFVKNFEAGASVVRAHDTRRRNNKKTVELKMLLQSTRVDSQKLLARVGRGYQLRRRLAEIRTVDRRGPQLRYLLRKHEWERRQIETDEMEEMSYLVTFASYTVRGFCKNNEDRWPELFPIRKYPLEATQFVESWFRSQLQVQQQHEFLKIDAKSLIAETNEFMRVNQNDDDANVVNCGVRQSARLQSASHAKPALAVDFLLSQETSQLRRRVELLPKSGGVEHFYPVRTPQQHQISPVRNAGKNGEFADGSPRLLTSLNNSRNIVGTNLNNHQQQQQPLSLPRHQQLQGDYFDNTLTPIRPVMTTSSRSSPRHEDQNYVVVIDHDGIPVNLDEHLTALRRSGRGNNDNRINDAPVFISNQERVRLASAQRTERFMLLQNEMEQDDDEQSEVGSFPF